MRGLRELCWVELKLFFREPLTVLFVLILPVIVLYVLNGVFGNRTSAGVYNGLGPIDFYTPTYVALVAATAGVLSVSVHLAAYRERGVLRRFRASPLPTAALLAAHVFVALLMGVTGAILIAVLSATGYGGALPHDWPGTVLAFLLVSIAFAALGVLLGILLRTARAAQGLGVLLFFVFMMLGGAGPPKEVLPATLARLADAVPLTYAARALRGPWLGLGWDTGAVAVMAALLVLTIGLTAWRLNRIEA
ncbi:ABC transporter permease [Amycolatopsis benzoatilytica]|uniref:ABC transporter permease n=1 Tax=Amycolatopsis benzoatilytica TaxID=346045 RepID=UPI000377761C|nr:ABC transporter permease [Amycolatopsis benzoatilytica]